MSKTLRAKFHEIEEQAVAGDYTAALRRLDELTREFPSEYLVWATRAYLNGRRGARDEAIADWSKAIALCNTEPHCFYMRGIDLFALRKYAEAASDFTRVIELCDLHESDYYREGAHFFRADTYVRLGEYEKARLECLKVSDQFRTWTDGIRCKADLLAQCPDPEAQNGKGSQS
jgi:tetratricopeptide (TPR) repeat protein